MPKHTKRQGLTLVASNIETCEHCGGPVKVIACIEEQETIDRILTHLHRKEQETPILPHLVPPTRAPPGTRWIDAQYQEKVPWVRCFFSWERALGSRTCVITVQSAGTPLNIGSAWIPACSGPGRAGKDLQDTGISWILVGDTATSPSFQVQRLKFWKKIALSTPRLFVLYFTW